MALSTAAQEMLRDMLNKPLYVALRHPVDLARMSELLEAHLQWAIGAERRGELFASGPFVSEDCAPGALGGMSIVRAASVEEAQQVLAQDPFVREGAVDIELKKWLLMEGSMTVTVRLSNQSSRLL